MLNQKYLFFITQDEKGNLGIPSHLFTSNMDLNSEMYDLLNGFVYIKNMLCIFQLRMIYNIEK